MNRDQLKSLRELYSMGFAVAIFTPDELNGVDSKEVESAMIEAGWDKIDQLMDPNQK